MSTRSRSLPSRRNSRVDSPGGGYVLIRDTTCRLFGYHGLIRDGAAFSLDHMFGF